MECIKISDKGILRHSRDSKAWRHLTINIHNFPQTLEISDLISLVMGLIQWTS